MSSIKEMAIQCKQLDAQITKAAQKAFKDCSEGRACFRRTLAQRCMGTGIRL